MHVAHYSAADGEAWNDFVRASRNGTFLLERAYMDYHSDRFHDASLIVRGREEDIVAVLPGNRTDNVVTSHGGLTYGGLIVGESATVSDVLALFAAVVQFLADDGVEHLIYKTVPYIYHRAPAEEDRYALFRQSAELVRRDVLSVIDYRRPILPQERRMRAIRKAKRGGLTVSETTDFAPFWSVLSQNLKDRHGVLPVHSLEEISLLASRFPDNIRLFTATRDGTTFGGVVVFVTETVCHVQYNAATAEGKDVGAQDAVFAELVEQFRGTTDYFDFGISNESDGRVLNAGLIEYKCGFGARTVVHDFYRVDIRGKA